MNNAIGIAFKENGQVYYFDPNGYKLKKNVTVIVRTERGLQFGKVVTDLTTIDENKLNTPLKKVVRIASKEDYQNNQKNIKDAKQALLKCRKLVEKNNLNMQIIDASYTFDRDQLLFHFLSDSRIDFRDLVKDLATIYKTRIELRQVGARDKAKEIGGCGFCGKALCCSTFLKDLDSVSINMAKNQNLSLNPTKINGVCGRLLCCLRYEDECYKECKKHLPNIGKKIKTDKYEGVVTNIDILKKKYYVTTTENEIIEVSVEDGNN